MALSLSAATALPITVGTSQKSVTVTLSENPEWGSGEYYFKVYLKNGSGYTFWSTGNASVSANMGLWNSEFGDLDGYFSGWQAYDGLNFWMKISPDDWWEATEMPSGYYYLKVEGEAGDSFTLNWIAGANNEPIPSGTIENPKAITVGTTEKTSSVALRDGSYYYKTTLTFGKKYTFWTTGGTEANGGLVIQVEPEANDVAMPVVTEVDDDDDFNHSIIVVPAETATYLLQVVGDDTSSFTLHYQVMPARLPANHPNVTALGAPPLEGAESGPFDAGARNVADSGFFDPVIDEHLFSASLVKDALYVFETAGDAAPDGLVMEVYDATGAVLFSNRQKAPGETHTRIAFQAPATATYWIGVGQAIEEPAAPVPFTLAYRKLAVDETGAQDAWDRGDDTLSGASALAPVPGEQGDSAVAVGAGHGPHTLGLTDWADWFRVDARKDIKYKLQAETAAGMEAFALLARIYTLSGTTLKLVKTIPDLAAGGELASTLNGSYYVEVFVEDGQGVDYGPYTLYALAYKTGVTLGMLQVDIGGPTAADGGSWSLLSDGTSAPKYPGGATVLLPAGGQTVKFNPVTGWATPANEAVTVNAGAVPTVVTVNYNDTSDPKDDLPATATSLTPTNKSQKRSHSLWAADAADWFKVGVKAGSYYTFTLAPFTGAPRLTIYRGNLTDVVAEGTEVRFLSDEAGTYYVKVAHAAEGAPVDSAYTLNYLAQAVGTVRIEKSAFTFKEGTAAATLKVLRSAKDGRIRVRYQTQQGTALPGTDYKPVKGYLEWADGNAGAQTITVPLIPDLYATWDENRAFTVLIEAVPAGELDEGELVPLLADPTVATVTITEITKKAPGKLAVSGFGPDGSLLNPFGSAKSPSVAVNAGDEVTLWITRTGGAEGPVTAQVATVKGTALAGVNYEDATETLVWGAGDASAQPFTVRTLPTEDAFQATKTLTVKLTVDRTLGGGATLGTSSVSVQVRDPIIGQTLEEWLAAGLDESGGTFKPGVAGAWFFDIEGSLRCAPLVAKAKAELTLTLVGPGMLTFAGELVSGGEGDNSTFTCMSGSKTTACGSGDETVWYLPKGKQTVKFTVTRGTTSPAGADVFGRFTDLGGQPFLWVPVPAPVPTGPAALSVVSPSADVTLEWAGEHEEFRLYVADSASKLTVASALIAEYVPAHEFCTSCGDYPSFVAGKTYYWRVDAVVPGEDPLDPTLDLLTSAGPVWAFTVGAEGLPVTEELAANALSAFADPSGTGYRLVQGLPCRIGPFDAPNGETFKATGLPAGVSLKVEAGQTYLVGTPSKTNSVTAKLQAFGKNGTQVLSGATFAVPFAIAPAGLAAGSFNGLLTADAENANESLASLSYTASEAGALSAKVLVAGKTYAFKGSGFSEDIPALDNGQPGLRAELILTSVVAGVTYTNTLTVTACRGAGSDTEAIDTPVTAELTLWIAAADNKSAREVAFQGRLIRDNGKLALVADVLTSAAGYYTVSLPVLTPADGAPAGAGSVTLTLAATGKAKLAGVLADGTTWTSSTPPGYQFADSESGRPAWLIPVFVSKAKLAMGGWITIAEDLESGLPVATGLLDWYNADTTSTRGGVEGYSLILDAAGGYYDTLFNLQAYYLNAELTVGASGAPAAYDATYTHLLCTPETFGLGLAVLGDAMSVSKRTLVKVPGSTKLYDYENSVNPCNLSLSFKRATGLFSGTFSLWYGNADDSAQKEKAGVKFQGVLTPVKASGSAYAGSPALGHYLIAEKIGTRTWNGSYLFEIRAQEVLPDWSEGWTE
jgi:hypothetical protein